MNLGLDGRVALVTGAGKGIGRAIAVALAREGCHLALVDRDRTAAEDVARELEESGRRALVFESDVADVEGAEEVVDRVRDELGRIDVLVCNAGIARTGSCGRWTRRPGTRSWT